MPGTNKSWPLSRPTTATMPLVAAGVLAMTVGLIGGTDAPSSPAHTADNDTHDRAGDNEVVGPDGTAPDRDRATASIAGAPQRYLVADGDSVSAIAARFGLETGAILTLNGLDGHSLIFPGQELTLVSPDSAKAEPGDSDGADSYAAAPATHVITQGDTVSSVAGSYGVGVQEILDTNGLTWSSIIYPGQELTIPTAAITASTDTAQPVSGEPAGQSASGVPLTDEMRRNAQTILTVARSLGVSEYGQVIALATAMQESGLRNLDWGDRDSLGLFQQRPSTGWGTASEIFDPTISTRQFFLGAAHTRGLLDIADWETLSVSAAAQAVQISGHPDAYAKWETPAREWLRELD